MKGLNIILKVTVFISGLLLAAHLVLYAIIKHKHNIDIRAASSIGIIGGADGPTVVFISKDKFKVFKLLLSVCTCTAVVSAFFHLYNRNRSNKL